MCAVGALECVAGGFCNNIEPYIAEQQTTNKIVTVKANKLNAKSVENCVGMKAYYYMEMKG